MEIILGIFVAAIIYLVFSKKKKFKDEENDYTPINMDDPSTVPTHDTRGNRSFLSRIAEIASDPTADLGQDWRFDPASDRQLARIEEMFSDVDFSGPSNLTKGQASDIIGLFEDPEDNEIEILRFFKIPKAGHINQTDCRRKIHEIMLDPANVAAWEERPANTDQKDQIKYLSGKVPKGLKAKDAGIIIEDLIKVNLEKAAQYEELKSCYEDLVDPDTRDLYDIKKFSLSQYLKTIDSLKEKGEEDENLLSNEDLIVEELIKLYPKLIKT